MSVKQIDHLNMTVQSFQETADWYQRVFGFEIVEEGLYNGVPWGVIKSDDAMLCIYEHPEFEGMAKGKAHGVNHIGLRITDRDSWLETVERENLKIRYEGEVHWPNSSSWYVTDPTGYEIEVALWNDDAISFDGV